MIKELQRVPLRVSRQGTGYLGLTLLFFALSLGTVYFVFHSFSGGQFRIPANLFSAGVIGSLAVLLALYFLADGLRLYCVIRAMDFRIAFTCIFKLVFINFLVSNVTPLATGGGVAQVYFLNRNGMTVGEATAATSIRTILAALILFTLTPVILWGNPNLVHIFFHRNMLYGITLISCAYIAVFWIILYKIRKVKHCVFRGLYLLTVLKIVSRLRFRTLFLKVSCELDLFSCGFKKYFRNNPGWAILSVVFTALFLLLLFSFSIVLIRALGYQVPVLTILAFQVVVTFFMYFAPTPGATGIAEGGYGLLFAQLVDKQDITLLTLSWRFFTIYVGVAIGILVLCREIVKRKKAGCS
ncbi:flippase-like domain-containing protein [Desulforhopalus vacuolatus]|uniref:lysylphosphatidylglycerol synthase transmembrane domain-containing protein n=1 Tax=Desulforhopalus vacuolatus TaxID=40414 RepID=UPI0019642092|nr:lysylphosphatidylglycerol synthase transmembrane domain-containing protein [Desulforhopalus vacuolatus]MBM9519097.1 flippase-like domain-containing protein [Desulforhopalus vacuolatus]